VSESGRPDIQFLPVSTDPGKIRFFGTLMPALLLLKAAPWHFVRHQVAGRTTPRGDVPAFIVSAADDAARAGDTLVFVHRWQTAGFDPLAFARAKTFLSRATRLVRREGYAAHALDPLSPDVNLPNLAAEAGLGTLSPFGLLVHPAFGPRLIITALKTDYPLKLSSRYQGSACTDCLSCLEICPQTPAETAVVELGRCQSCAQCLAVCPVGAD
jgi:NAD-dependent dihydropyrimidine dehydrogenase PreA subunit